MNNRLFSLFSLLILSSTVFGFFCPTNYNQINIGDTTEKVDGLCGKPDTQKTIKKKADPDLAPQEWSYIAKTDTDQQNGMRITIIFQNKKAISITVNGAGIGTTSLCEAPIQVGDNMDDVKKACGKPVFVTLSADAPQSPPSETVITEYHYINTATPFTLIFENGKLKQRVK